MCRGFAGKPSPSPGRLPHAPVATSMSRSGQPVHASAGSSREGRIRRPPTASALSPLPSLPLLSSLPRNAMDTEPQLRSSPPIAVVQSLPEPIAVADRCAPSLSTTSPKIASWGALLASPSPFYRGNVIEPHRRLPPRRASPAFANHSGRFGVSLRTSPTHFPSSPRSVSSSWSPSNSDVAIVTFLVPGDLASQRHQFQVVVVLRVEYAQQPRPRPPFRAVLVRRRRAVVRARARPPLKPARGSIAQLEANVATGPQLTGGTGAGFRVYLAQDKMYQEK